MPSRLPGQRRDADLGRALERLDALEHFAEGLVKLAMLRYTATQDWLQIHKVADVDHLIDTVDECAHGVIGGKTVT